MKASRASAEALIRDLAPGSFAFVMATGIMSTTTALGPSLALAARFAGLAAVFLWAVWLGLACWLGVTAWMVLSWFGPRPSRVAAQS